MNRRIIMPCLLAGMLAACSSTGGGTGTHNTAWNKQDQPVEIKAVMMGNDHFYIAGNTLVNANYDNENFYYLLTETFDDKGHRLSQTREMSQGYKMVLLNEYDETGRLTQRTDLRAESSDYKIYSYSGTRMKYTYDEDRLTGMEEIDVSGNSEAELEERSAETWVLEYNDNGQVITRTSGSEVYEYTYNDHGCLKAEQEIANLDGRQAVIYEAFYDETGMDFINDPGALLSYASYDPDGAELSSYDYSNADNTYILFTMEDGRLVPKEEGTATIAAGKAVEYRTNGYHEEIFYLDSEGHELLELQYTSDDWQGALEGVDFTIYDKEGRIIEKRDGQLYTDFTYDEAGNLLSELELDAYGEPYYQHRYEYDENNNCIRSIYYACDHQTAGHILLYEYDDHGRQISDTQYVIMGWDGSDVDVNALPVDLKAVTEYETDAAGNVISKVVRYDLIGGEFSFREDSCSYTYDSMNRIATEERMDTRNQVYETVQYEYY